MNQFLDYARKMAMWHPGALDSLLEVFAEQLSSEGYGVTAARRQISFIAEFSKWLSEKNLSSEMIAPKHAEKFLQRIERKRQLKSTDPAALKRILAILRQQGIIQEELVVVAQPTPAQKLRDDFLRYLREERGLSPATQFQYQVFVDLFLEEQHSGGEIAPSDLRPIHIVGFVKKQADKLRPKRAKLMTSALRSFLHFLYYRGFVDVDLRSAVPKILSWSMAELPKALPQEHVLLALEACDRESTRGVRDYAILVLLSRLGLRAGEVVSLTLDDIDWYAGTITIRGKGDQIGKLPLPADVGEAIAEYLQKGRPQTTSRALFFTVKAPLVPFSRQEVVGHLVARILARAEIKTERKGAHQFRHALASEMLQQGATLGEIGELLRHNSPQSTMIYAKVDLVSLRQLALPWMEEVQ